MIPEILYKVNSHLYVNFFASKKCRLKSVGSCTIRVKKSASAYFISIFINHCTFYEEKRKKKHEKAKTAVTDTFHLLPIPHIT